MDTLHKKIRLQPNQMIATLNAPENFGETLEPLPPGAKFQQGFTGSYSAIYWFVKNRPEMEKDLKQVLNAMKDDTLVWIFYPKGTSGIQTDLTRDKGWDALMKRPDLQWVSLISFDDTWSAFAMRKKSERDKRREEKPKERLIFQYADSNTKTIKLPDDMKNIFSKNKKAKEIFDVLSFSNRREYVEWIITAKREETRIERLNQMIHKLKNGWKNPSGR